MDARSRVDAELREHRHAITNAFTQEELASLRKKVQEHQHELGKLREQLKEQQHGWEKRHKRKVCNRLYIPSTNILEYVVFYEDGSIDNIDSLTNRRERKIYARKQATL